MVMVGMPALGSVRARWGLRTVAGLENDLAVLDLQALEPADHIGVLGIVISVLGQILLAQLRQESLRRRLAVNLERLQGHHQNALAERGFELGLAVQVTSLEHPDLQLFEREADLRLELVAFHPSE